MKLLFEKSENTYTQAHKAKLRNAASKRNKRSGKAIESLKNKQNNHGLHSCIPIRGIHKLSPGLASKHKHSPKGWWDCRGKHLAKE